MTLEDTRFALFLRCFLMKNFDIHLMSDTHCSTATLTTTERGKGERNALD